MACNAVMRLLTELFNKCLAIVKFPDAFKFSNIILFPKTGKDPKQASSYRPIALLLTIGKALEKLIIQRLTYFLETNNRLNNNQHGFREGRSTDTALTSLMDKIQTGKRKGNHVPVLSVDIKGAFDNIQHAAIINNLDKNKTPLNIRNIFKSLLENRRVLINTQEGPVNREQKQGCSQGSCSGPALWNLVANDLLNQDWPDQTFIQAFADDFIIVAKAKSIESLRRITTEAINTFVIWADANSLAISATGRLREEKSGLVKTSFQLSHSGAAATRGRKQRRQPYSAVHGWLKDTEWCGSGLLCHGRDGVITCRWSTKLRDENIVFQAELLALKEAIQYATYITSHQPIKILTDNKASIQASTNPKTHNATAQELFETLLDYPQIELQWIKAHAGYLGNETADQLAKEAAESDMTPLIIKLPKCHLKNVLRAMMINAWQKN
ncbi:Retrovirus-related Pol polyprotein from type-1 retrotransposable element R1 [Araneus ventricosus]|uniref:Retrovirus-related Pol polyprotein from type-1 retrotransposable element R1 n=1 Tax=Araneus ventricosus TaxID=182803 RepID=A0A4Y2CQU6_ARAVE|nr:Retrovirus-related Pol polyprotein from type-1 retrotransposable element R1 [Araneus ventricosus]